MWSKYSLRCPFSGSIITPNLVCGRSASLSPAPPEDRAAVWWHLLHRGVIWVSFRPHRGAGRPLQLLAAHQSLLWRGQSWTRPLQRTLHVDPLLQWWRAGGDWLQGPVQLYCRWLKHSGMVYRSLYGNVLTAWYSLNVHPVCSNNASIKCLKLLANQISVLPVMMPLISHYLPLWFLPKTLNFICMWEDS